MARRRSPGDADREFSAARGRYRSNEPELLRETVEAALRSGGSAEAMAMRLDLDARTLAARLKLLRRRGLARRVVMAALPRPGREIEARSYIKIAGPSAETLDRFEAFCLAEARITAAALIAGRHDYVVTTFHGSLADVRDWSHALRNRVDVARVDVQVIRTISGLSEYLVLPAASRSGRKRTGR